MKTQKQKQTRGSSTSAAAIVNHQLRARLWDAYSERVASPAILSKEWGESLNDCSYHTRVLAGLKVIELVGERQVRGAVEHLYRAIDRPDFRGEVTDLSPEDSIANCTRIMQANFAEVSMSLGSGTFIERDEHVASRFPLLLDEQGFRDAGAAHEELAERLYEILAESAGRMAELPAEKQKPVHASSAFFLFEKSTTGSGSSK